MPDSQSSRAARSKPPARLLTRAEVISALREERARLGLSKTAEKYGLKASQVCDVLAIPPRAKLSGRMAERLRWKIHELFERLPG